MCKRMILILSIPILVVIFVFACGPQHLSSDKFIGRSQSWVSAPSPVPPMRSTPPLHLSPDSSEITMLSITMGQVFMMKPSTNNWAIAKVGMNLEIGDIIKTNDASGALVTFSEGSTIELQAGAEVNVGERSVATDTVFTTIGISKIMERNIIRLQKLVDPGSISNHRYHNMLVSTLRPFCCLIALW